MNITYDSHNHSFNFNITKDLSSKEVIMKCLYWYQDAYDIDINDNSLISLNVIMNSKKKINLSVEEQGMFINKLKQDFIDFSLRQIVTNETKNIRDLLIAKAFKSFE